MPLYEYSCRRCGEAFEVLQRMGERGDELRCPACGATGADRRLSTFAAGSGSGSGRAATAAAGPAPGCGAGGFT